MYRYIAVLSKTWLTNDDVHGSDEMHKRDDIVFFARGPGFPGGRFGGPGGFGPGPFGPGGFGPRWKMRHGRRIRRGDVRAAIPLLVEEEPRNGYQIMQELESRSGGVWRPSPGSVYPALQLLADEGLIRSEARDGGNVFELTEAGKAHVEEHRERLGSPWEQAGEGVPEGVRELGGLLGQVGVAVQQVMQAGTEAQVAAASKLLADARRSLYGVLAEDETPPSG
jgi:DNA-binding PadR family transcriptional regulator